MALGDPYIDATDLKQYLGVQTDSDKAILTDAIAAATESVNEFCDRDFNRETVATPRVYKADTCGTVRVDDFWTTSGLIIATDADLDGAFEATWSSDDYDLEPLNGIESGKTGFPYRTIRAVNDLSFPVCKHRATVQVTAKWGWAAVPAKVKQATRILAAQVYRLKDAPLGVAGFGDFGPVRVQTIPQVAMMLSGLEYPSRSGPLVA